jgi:hypothetical protein
MNMMTGEPHNVNRRSNRRAPRLRTLTLVGIATIGCLLGAPPAWAAGITSPPASSGRLLAIGQATLTVQARGGQGTITTSTSTRYYQALATTSHSLSSGQTVAIITSRASTTAVSVTIAATGSGTVVFVRSSGRPGGGQGGGDDGGAGDGGEGGGVGQGLTGKIATIASGAITIVSSSGTKQLVTLSASTKLYRVTAIARAQLRTGLYVAARVGMGIGAPAGMVVEAAPGATVSFGGTGLGASLGAGATG